MKPLYGVTHTVEGSPIVHEPKTVKVGIGLPKGKAIHVYIDLAKKWVVVVGKEAKRFETKAEAKKFYRDAKATAPERKYPQRLAHFVFNRISPDGSFEPEWDAVETHGPMPTEIDIVFVKDDPFMASYQMWTATERKCEGDGLNATRINSMAQSQTEKDAASQAERNGEKYFPIVGGCWTRGCPYSKSTDNKPSPCKPHGRLLFQLLNAPRLGGTAYFDTTGFRSISQLFSCIQTFKAVTGQGDPERGFVAGIPLKMVLRPYRTAHNGQAATQYGVALEFRADSALDLKRRLIEHGVQFRIADAEPLKQLTAAPDAPIVDDEDEEPEVIAAAMNAEFDGSSLPDNDDFADPEAEAETPKTIAMPRRKSEPEPAQEDYSHVAPELEACWEPETHLPPTPQPESPKQPNEKWKRFYDLCRSKGMVDAVIHQQLGTLGFETPGEITDKGYAELTKWSNAYKPTQSPLLK